MLPRANTQITKRQELVGQVANLHGYLIRRKLAAAAADLRQAAITANSGKERLIALAERMEREARIGEAG